MNLDKEIKALAAKMEDALPAWLEFLKQVVPAKQLPCALIWIVRNSGGGG